LVENTPPNQAMRPPPATPARWHYDWKHCATYPCRRNRIMRDPDPIVDDVRAIRDAIAKEFDYDIEKLADAIKAREVQSERKVVRLPPRKVTTVRRAS